MNDIDTREEERILRSITRKSVNGIQPNPRNIVRTPLAPVELNRSVPVTTNTTYTKERKEKEVKEVKEATQTTTLSSNSNGPDQLEQLQLKKRTLLGTIATTRRDLDDVRTEINKLKVKEAEMVALLDKREKTVKRLTQEIDEKEQNLHSEKYRIEEEKAHRVREEVGRRRREEEEENRLREMEKRQSVASVVQAQHTDESTSEGMNSEELRLMRAMTRSRGSSTGKPASTHQSKQSVLPPISEPSWKEIERLRDFDRATKISEESKKKDAERRVVQERENSKRNVEQQRIFELQRRSGIKHIFTSPVVYDFDAEIKICGDFTDWEEVPITTPIENNFTYSITLPVSSGIHFYRFKVSGKWDVNKNMPTGVAHTGEVMNKIEV